MRNLVYLWMIANSGLLLLAGSGGGAQNPSLLYTKWVNYTAANGFPPGKVYCVKVDGKRVWAGTEHGLVLIEDGRVRRIFTPADGLAGRAVMSVAVDNETGDVWIGAFGGLSRYSGGQFKNYTNLSSGLANDLVYSVAVQNGDVWVATAAGVCRLDSHTESWTIFNEKNAPFEEPWSYSIAFGKGKIYMGVWGGGVIVYDPATHSWRPYTDPDGEMEIVLYRNQGLIHNIVSSVAYNEQNGMVWAATYFGLSGYDGRNWHNYLTKDSAIASDFINAVQSRGNLVWACTDKGLSCLNYATNTWTTYRSAGHGTRGDIEITGPDGQKTKIETPTGLAHNYTLNVDFQGEDAWVATGEGLSHGTIQPQNQEHIYESTKSRH